MIGDAEKSASVMATVQDSPCKPGPATRDDRAHCLTTAVFSCNRCRTCWSFRNRHRKFRPFGDRFRPALHDRFVARVKAYALFAINMRVAKQRALPAAERMPGHRYRNRNIDADHADLDAPRKLARRV